VKYSLGFDAGPKNSCALREVENAFERSESFADLFRSLAASPGFLRRDTQP
jgi:hypothetical protein